MNTGRRYYFLTIAETCNITRAAERLRVSQPSLTQYLNKLEDELGVKLLDRRFTPLRLTEAGEIYRDYLLQQQKHDQRLMERLRPFRPEAERTLTVGVPLQRSPDIAKRVLPGFIASHPDISLSIWEGTALSVRERVHAGQLQLGFGYTYSGAPEPCVVHDLERERIVIVCNAENPIAAGISSTMTEPAILPPEALADELFYQMSPEYVLYTVETQYLERHGVEPQRRVVLSNLSGIVSALADSPQSGYAFIPHYTFLDTNLQPMLSRLAYFQLDETPLEWSFALMRAKDAPLTREARAFWNSVMEQYK